MEQDIKTYNRNEIDLVDLFFKIWHRRWFIFSFTVSIAIIAIIYSLLANEQYEASVSLYKETGKNQSSSGLQSLASQFGLGSVIGGSTQFSIDDLLESRKINKRILYNNWETEKFKQPVNLIEYWEIEGENEREVFFEAISRIKAQVSTSINEETGLITITVLMPEPQLAADVVNFITDIITEYVQTERKTTTLENLKYIEKRINTVEKELREAEEELKRFRERNRVLSESPGLQMEFGRLQRKVTIKQEVYLTLQKEREMAEIDLVKETPVINILDEGIKPDKRAKPKRSVIVIISTFVGFFFSIILVILYYVWTSFKKEMNKRGESLRLF